MGEQHTDMYMYGDQGSKFSLESMRTQAKRRLERGWSTTIHMHTHAEDCKAEPDRDCEFYAAPSDEDNLPDPVPPYIEDHTVASERDYAE